MNVTEVRAILAELGPTPSHVVRSLRRLGIRGGQTRADRCVLAQYLLRCGVPDPAVGNEEIAWGESASQMLRLPPYLQDFVNDFDDGSYPELLEEGLCLGPRQCKVSEKGGAMA